MPTSLELVLFVVFLYLLLVQLMLLKRIMIPENVLTSVLGSGDGGFGPVGECVGHLNIII